jgi:uncharacterized MnhB-related membrane protein
MKFTKYIVLAHMILSSLLWILEGMVTTSWCLDGCRSLPYWSGFAFLIINAPGVAIVDTITAAPGADVTVAHGFASAVVTEFLFLAVVSAIVAGFINASKRG